VVKVPLKCESKATGRYSARRKVTQIIKDTRVSTRVALLALAGSLSSPWFVHSL
jgi:hypothetical protein